MRASKGILGIYLSGVDLKTVFATLSKGGKIRVEAFDQARLIGALKQPVAEVEEKATEGQVDFAPEDEEGVEASNRDILLDLLRRVPTKRLGYAINLPASLTSTFLLRNGYADLRARQLRKRVLSEMRERLDGEVPNDHLDFLSSSENDVLVFSYKGIIPFIQACDDMRREIKGRPRFVLVEPDVVSLLNLVRFNQEPDREEIIAIIDIEEETSRIIVARVGGDEDFLHTAPPIRESSNSESFLRTIYSKLVYELDVGDIDDFDRVILTGKAREVGAKKFLKEKLGGTKVEYITINSDKIIVPDELRRKVSSYAVPLGLAIKALQPTAKNLLQTNFLPDYVRSRQRVLKIAWHGILILLLILLIPIVTNWQKNQKALALRKASQKVVNLQMALADIEWVEPLVNDLAYRATLSDARVALIDSLAKASQRWSVTLGHLSRAVREVNNIWITELSSRKRGIQLAGFSLYRNRIPMFASHFANATIQRVTPAKIRGKVVYRFSLGIEAVVDDPSDFDPVVELPASEELVAALDVAKATAVKPEARRPVKRKPTKSGPKQPEAATPMYVTSRTLPSLFDNALEDFMNGRYDQSLPVFESIAVAGLDHPLTDNAQYWVGECYFAQGDPGAASVAIERLLMNHPTTNKGSEALLLLGRSYAQLGRTVEAFDALQRVLEEHPKSESAPRARQLITSLRKK